MSEGKDALLRIFGRISDKEYKDLHDAFTKLETALDSQGSGWMPIADAPKDGTHVWMIGENWEHPLPMWWSCAEAEDPGAWYCRTVHNGKMTHWMPLPSPPKEPK